MAEPTIQKQGNNRVIVELAGIEDSDLIILIGTNPRYEATILI